MTSSVEKCISMSHLLKADSMVILIQEKNKKMVDETIRRESWQQPNKCRTGGSSNAWP